MRLDMFEPAGLFIFASVALVAGVMFAVHRTSAWIVAAAGPIEATPPTWRERALSAEADAEALRVENKQLRAENDQLRGGRPYR